MTIHIEALTFECIIGLLVFERTTPQQLIVDLELSYTYTDTFINYADLANLIETHLKKQKYELLESALENLFSIISQAYPEIENLYIKITKPDILPNCRVCVSNFKEF
jgi:dihydroneopterin aldolase